MSEQASKDKGAQPGVAIVPLGRTWLARLERSSAGKFGNEAGGALGAGGGQ